MAWSLASWAALLVAVVVGVAAGPPDRPEPDESNPCWSVTRCCPLEPLPCCEPLPLPAGLAPAEEPLLPARGLPLAVPEELPVLLLAADSAGQDLGQGGLGALDALLVAGDLLLIGHGGLQGRGAGRAGGGGRGGGRRGGRGGGRRGRGVGGRGRGRGGGRRGGRGGGRRGEVGVVVGSRSGWWSTWRSGSDGVGGGRDDLTGGASCGRTSLTRRTGCWCRRCARRWRGRRPRPAGRGRWCAEPSTTACWACWRLAGPVEPWLGGPGRPARRRSEPGMSPR